MKKTLIIVFGILLLVQCKKECPLFNRELLVWQPYNIGDTLKFKDENDSLRLFIISSFIISEGQKYPKCSKCYCLTQSSVGSYGDSENSIERFSFSIKEEMNIKFTININSFLFSCEPDFGNNTYFVYAYKYNFQTSSWSSKTMNIIDELEINNKIYNDVIELETDTIKNGNYIWKLYLAKNHGIIKFCDRTTKSSFIIQD